MSKIKIGLAVTLVAVSSYFIVRAADTLDFVGFAWIGNNLQGGIEQGDPVIGMVRMNGEKFQMGLAEEANGVREVTGSAWLGIGVLDDGFNDFTSQSDLPSIGWIYFDSADALPASCSATGDCHKARWNRKPGSTGVYEGYLSGWAKMVIGPDSLGVPYPDVWVHFKAPSDINNYTCNGTEQNYSVCIDEAGKVHGYAWSSGVDANTIANNPGLGWIQFSKNYAGVIAAGAKDCTVIAPATRTACSGKTTTFGAYYPSTMIPVSYKWKCDTTQEDYEEGAWFGNWKKECIYDTDGLVTSELIITDADSDDVSCYATSIRVTSEKKCTVEVRKKGDDDYSSSINVLVGDEVEAVLTKDCMEGGVTSWEVITGEELTSGSSFLNAKFNSKQEGKITAEVELDGGEVVNCTDAAVNVSQKVKWGEL